MSTQTTLDKYYSIEPLKKIETFIIAPRDMGRMVYDFEYNDASEKDAMWGE